MLSRLVGSGGRCNALITTALRASPVRFGGAAAVGAMSGASSSGGLLSSGGGIMSGGGASNWLGIGCGAALGGGMHSLWVRWATKKAAGSTHNKRDSPGRRLGIKEFGNSYVLPGYIICRQRGTKWHPGMNVSLGRDHTITSLIEGRVRFTHTVRPWRRRSQERTWISVVPEGQDPAILRAWFDANQSKYLRVINDKYHSVPRKVWAPRERAIKLLTDRSIKEASELDKERQKRATIVGPAEMPVPIFQTPLRAHTLVTKVRTRTAVFGPRRKERVRLELFSRILQNDGKVPIPTQSPAIKQNPPHPGPRKTFVRY